jgi:hypothetical protein
MKGEEEIAQYIPAQKMGAENQIALSLGSLCFCQTDDFGPVNAQPC